MVQRSVQELVRWIVALNVGPDADVPEFVLFEREDAVAEAEADAKKAARDKAVAELRAHYSDDYLEKTYRLPQGALREREETPPDNPAFAEPSPDVSVEAYARAMKERAPVDALSVDLSPAFEAMLAPVLDRLAQAGDYSEQGMAKAVTAEYPKMNLEDMADMLARIRFVCRVWGLLNG